MGSIRKILGSPSSDALRRLSDLRASPTEPVTGHGGQIDVGPTDLGQSCSWCLIGRFSTMKKYNDIDYDFRPESYWNDSDPLAAILRNVTGENRRQMITDYWNAGRLE